MIKNSSMTNTSWNVSPPNIEDVAIELPVQFLKNCPNLIRNNTINHQAISLAANKSFSNKLIYWSTELLSSIKKSPGMLLIRANHSNLNDEQLKSLYYIISKGFGNLSNRYGELFEVKDRNLDYKKEAIPVSKTNSSTGFHTDSTAIDYSPDIVGLLCLQPAKVGGDSIFANATDLFLWMRKFYPDAASILSKPIIRDVITCLLYTSPSPRD